MKKFYVIGMCIALSLMLSSCNLLGSDKKTDATEESKSADESVATDSEDSTDATDADTTSLPSTIAITAPVPDGWTAIEGSVIPVQYSNFTASFMVMKEVYFSSNNLDEVVTQAQAIFTESFDNVEYIGDVKTLTIDGYDARQFIFTCELMGLSMKYQYNYIKIGEDIYSVIFADFATTYEDMAPDFEQILTDIQFG
jgi:hypothetical protein